jgi:hypothetical protein
VHNNNALVVCRLCVRNNKSVHTLEVELGQLRHPDQRRGDGSRPFGEEPGAVPAIVLA